MFGIGSTELLVILLVALIVLGPSKLAGVSRSLGKMLGEFRRVSTDFQRTLNMEAAAEETRQAEKRRNAAENSSGAEKTGDEPQPAAGEDTPLAQALAKSREDARSAEAVSTDANSSPSTKTGN